MFTLSWHDTVLVIWLSQGIDIQMQFECALRMPFPNIRVVLRFGGDGSNKM
jgi:hypothetical protein